MSEKTRAELLAEKLLYKPENGGKLLSDKQLDDVMHFCEDYKIFLDNGKTEREVVDYTIDILKKNGYVEFNRKTNYLAGSKVYYNNRGRALILATIGSEPIEKGVKILASHIDSPRIDLKPRPLYEEAQIGLLKTHYYGGIKKYQWGALPLSLHGVIIKKDGETVKVKIGEDPADPIFCITDLLPHLGKEQMERKLRDGIKGEELNVLIGSLPFKDDKASECVKLNLIRILNEKYGIVEADFLSAELCVVPVQNARDIGLDRSMIGSYGHDDRVCAYTSMMAAFAVSAPKNTTVTVFADKEEVGSDGNTGLNSKFLQYFIEDLAASQNANSREVFENSSCLSADVNCAFDPTWASVSEKSNNAFLNYGVVLTKYTGSGGKNSTNDCGAEFVGKVRKILDDANVIWQTGELGKVDMGGGGTVAKFIAALNIDVVDVGVPVLSMHAPFEVVSKIDVYMTYKAFEAFYNA